MKIQPRFTNSIEIETENNMSYTILESSDGRLIISPSLNNLPQSLIIEKFDTSSLSWKVMGKTDEILIHIKNK